MPSLRWLSLLRYPMLAVVLAEIPLAQALKAMLEAVSNNAVHAVETDAFSESGSTGTVPHGRPVR